MADNGFKIVRIQTIGFGRAAARADQLAQEGFANGGYRDAYEKICSDSAVYAAGFSRGMRQLGHDASEIVYDCAMLQRGWARENGLRIEQESNWQVEIALAQLRDIQPEVIFFQDIFSIPETTRKRIKEIIPSIRLVVIQKGYPGETRDLSDADILCVSSPILYHRYRNRGQTPYLVYHSFDELLSNQVQDAPKENREQLVFAGSSRAPEDRYWILRTLLQETGIKLWIDENRSSHKKHGGRLNTLSWKRYLRDRLIKLVSDDQSQLLRTCLNLAAKNAKVGRVLDHAEFSKRQGSTDRVLPGLKRGLLPKKTLAEQFPGRCHPSLFGKPYYELLSRSDIIFNIHSAKSRDTVDNMKMFEGTGMGGCLLTDTGTNMKDLFDEDYEVVTYRSADEAVEKARYLVENPKDALKIAEAGRAKTLACHTTANRCQEISEIIKKRI